jgi:hypothetical protein
VTAINDLDDFAALDPFFRIVEEGLSGLVDGDNFFNLLADGVVFEYIITVPGYPRYVVGRSAVAELYRPYGDTFVLHRCFDLSVHHDRNIGSRQHEAVFVHGKLAVEPLGARPRTDKDEQSADRQSRGRAIGVVTQHETLQGVVAKQRDDLGLGQDMDPGCLLDALDQVARHGAR